MKIIRIINRGERYRKALESIWKPIMEHLPKDSYIVEESGYDSNKKIWLNEKNKKYFNIGFFSDISERHEMFICHGAADKNYRYTKKLKLFDNICVTGNLWKEKLIKQGIEEKRIKVVGYPKLDDLFTKKKIKHTDGKIHVLYAPTHNVNPTLQNTKTISSYPRLNRNISNLDKNAKFEVITSCHPINNENNITSDLLLWADVVVSDSGSLIYESWSMDLPVVFPDWLVSENISSSFKGTFEQQIYQQGIGYHAKKPNDFKSTVLRAYEDGISSKSKIFIEGIFPRELRGVSGLVTAEEILKLI